MVASQIATNTKVKVEKRKERIYKLDSLPGISPQDPHLCKHKAPSVCLSATSSRARANPEATQAAWVFEGRRKATALSHKQPLGICW
jgi:hypothetical protein